MRPLSFAGRVAVVTGAGRGIGRAYALLLAERGARVVVNDLGGSMTGVGADDGPAAAVVAEITAAGGTALADGTDVADPGGASSLVGRAVETFGRLDILINNAGIMRWAGLPEVDADALARHLAVHLFGSFNTLRAAWPQMADQGYGRVVMTTSTGIFGLAENTAYATAKAAVVGLTRSAAVAGARHGIAINCIAPAAYTRMAGRAEPGDDPGANGPMATAMAPELVAPMAAFLAHEDCPVTGEIYTAGAGRFARLVLTSTPGYVHTGGTPTPEDVAEHWTAVNDETGSFVPGDLTAWSRAFLAHLPERDG